MNDLFRGKVEACLELSNGDQEVFKTNVMKVTSLTDKGFHELNMTDVAYEMLKRGESVDNAINAVL